jgi:acyl-CoA reductase-like NAD-dependent aldehyde dehydrogenase
MTPKAFFIGGEWVSSDQSSEIKNPYTHELVGTYFQAGAEQVEQAFQSAHEAFLRNRELTPAARALFLGEVATVIKRRSKEFVDLLIREAGKPVTQAETEVARAQSTFLFAASECRQPNGELIALDGSEWGKKHIGSVHRVPIGVIFGITPFNFPLNLVVHKVAPALAAGNAIVIKPSPRTVLTALLLAESLQEAGVPAGLVNIVPFDVGLMERYYTDERVKMISFTGSAAVGWKIKEKCNTKKVCLELGGNAAAIVHDDAEWENKIAPIANGAFGYAGQSCISIQRVYVQRRIYETFRDAFLGYVKDKVKTGDPRERETVIGPMIAPEAAQRVAQWVDQAVAAGAKLVTERSINGQCVGPIVLEEVPEDQPISCEEAFAPVVVLQPYDDFSDAIAKVNHSRWGMQTGVFTRDLKRAHQAFESLDVAAVLINQVPTFRVENMPYGGIKLSGFGREGVKYAMEEMTERKTLIVNYA